MDVPFNGEVRSMQDVQAHTGLLIQRYQLSLGAVVTVNRL